MHNDFHNGHGIFPLFDGLQVPDLDKPLHSTDNSNGEPVGNSESKQNGESSKVGEKSTIEVASDAVKSAASAITNGLSSLTVTN